MKCEGFSRADSTSVFPQSVWISYPHYPHVILLAISLDEEVVRMYEQSVRLLWAEST